MADSPWRVRHVGAELDVSVGVGADLLFTVSYLDRSGDTIGLAAAASGSDPATKHAARELVELWASTLRTRRALLPVTDSGCTGATCELLPATGDVVRRFRERGDTVLCVGAGDTRLSGTMPVPTVDAVRAMTGMAQDNLSFVIAPGAAVEEAITVLVALRARFPGLRGQHPDGLCYAASDRREALRSVAGASDLLLVCGSANAPDSWQLAQWTTQTGCPVHWIDDPARLRAEWLAPAATVGIVAAPSARPGLVDDVLTLLAGLGPLSLVRRGVTTTVLGPVTHRVTPQGTAHAVEPGVDEPRVDELVAQAAVA
jgi:4-hydroxy-3-methylbut-2-en-1-yl diphosphate reductase